MPEAMIVEKAAAIGVSVTCNLGGTRQVVLQTFYPQDAPPKELHAALDSLMSLADRQEAKYSLPDLYEELEKHEAAVRNLQADVARVDEQFFARMATLEAEYVKHMAEADRIFQEGYDIHVNEGKQGEYKPQGNRQQAFKVTGAAAAKVKEQITKENAEREQSLTGVMTNLERFEEQTAIRKAKIAKAEALVNGA